MIPSANRILRVTAVSALMAVAAIAQGPVPLERAHSHNDYTRARPLLDALENGFCSIEADIWLVEGALLVAHDRDKVDPAKTLEAMYLDPLRERVRANSGRVYGGGPEFILLIDIKSGAEETYAILHETLAQYEEMFSVRRGDEVEVRAIRAIVSGNRPRAVMEAQAESFAAYDGRPEDLGGGASAAFMPLISTSWMTEFEWRGEGPMPHYEQARLREIVSTAHAEGRKVRFWALPHRESLWEFLLSEGVDLINVDSLERLRVHLIDRGWAK